MDGDYCGAVSGMNEWQGKPKFLERTSPSAALSTTDPTWLVPGLDLGRRGGNPAINHVSCWTAQEQETDKEYMARIAMLFERLSSCWHWFWFSSVP
jgi:hypothetical protein